MICWGSGGFCRHLFGGDVLAAAEITEAAAVVLEVVTDLVNFFHRDRSNISDVFAPAGVTEAAAASLVVVAFLFIQILFSFSGLVTTATATTTAATTASTVAWCVTAFVVVGGRETGVVVTMGETALVTVLAAAVVSEIVALGVLFLTRFAFALTSAVASFLGFGLVFGLDFDVLP